MSIRKFISKALVLGIVLNSSMISNARTTLDGRYEDIKGSNIVIDNILEQQDIEVEVEGNTMVNLIDPYKGIKSSSISQDRNIYTWNLNGVDNWTPLYFNSKLFEPSTKYTAVINILENTLDDNFIILDGSGSDRVTSVNRECTPWSKGLVTVNFESKSQLPSEINKWYIQTFPGTSGTLKIEIVAMLKGEYSKNDVPKEAFTGLKSVGEFENNKLEIFSRSKNLALVENVFDPKDGNDKGWVVTKTDDNKFICEGDGTNATKNGFALGLNLYNLKPNTKYTLSYKTNMPDTPLNYIYQGANTLWKPELAIGTDNTFTTPSDVTEVCIGLYYRIPGTNRVEISDIQVEEGDATTEYVSPLESILELKLNEPLRSIPGVIKDRLVKKNGQWYVERNCDEVLFDGSSDEDWIIYEQYTNQNIFSAYIVDERIKNKRDTMVVCDKIIPRGHTQNMPYITSLQFIAMGIEDSKIESPTILSFKKWLTQNPARVIYQLNSPVYEPINAPVITSYLDKTYINNNSLIPADMKITIDRVLNKATEAVALAKSNPSLENVSLARMWTNLANDSLVKDQLQNEINGITEIENLEFEKKKATANMDVYVKSANTLSMALSTNSVSFDSYSGVSDMEKLKAVEITINSSLPYSLNSYLVTEIQNSNASKIMNRELFNIREASEGVYKKFTDVGQKLILKDDCASGNDIVHNIDMKLDGSNAHEADVYKTVVKFEAQQK